MAAKKPKSVYELTAVDVLEQAIVETFDQNRLFFNLEPDPEERARVVELARAVCDELRGAHEDRRQQAAGRAS
jgi:hypothetical protein